MVERSKGKGIIMADTNARIRVKLGQIEIEYEGDATFLKKNLIGTVKELLELQKAHPAATLAPAEQILQPGGGSAGSFTYTTSTVAKLLNAKSGLDLVMAAAAHLHFCKGKTTFTRGEITDEMKSAKSFNKPSYQSNLTKSLDALTKGQDRLRVTGTDTYSLSSSELEIIGPKLANG